MAINPFEFVNSVSSTKRDIWSEAAGYSAFTVNRALSYHLDTILYASEINRRAQLPPEWQYRYFLGTIIPRKRFAKWSKPDTDDRLEVIKEVYGFGDDKARVALSLINNEQFEELKKKLERGGRVK